MSTTMLRPLNEDFDALSLSVGWDQVIRPWLVAELGYDFVYLNGFLANAYRRVVVAGAAVVVVDSLHASPKGFNVFRMNLPDLVGGDVPIVQLHGGVAPVEGGAEAKPEGKDGEDPPAGGAEATPEPAEEKKPEGAAEDQPEGESEPAPETGPGAEETPEGAAESGETPAQP